MPTYTYQCPSCGKSQDLFHGISANPRIKCEKCGTRCKRMIGTGSGIIFKGTGFYETDYKTKTGTPPASSESGAKESSKKDTGSEKSGADKKSSKKDTKSSPAA